MNNRSIFWKIFPILFGIVFTSILFMTIFFTATCYYSGDPNSMACYMISERVEVGIRQR